MAFEYLWDRKDNVLVVRFPADFARRGMVGLMVSVDDGAGRHVPSLSVPLSLRLAEEVDVFLLAPLPQSDPNRRMYVTVEPVCSADSENPVPAERLALAADEPPQDAAAAYWILDPSSTPPVLAVDTIAPEHLKSSALVAQSRRNGDVIYPATPGYARHEAALLRLYLSLEGEEGALHHVIRFDQPAERRDAGEVAMSLVLAPDACKALVSSDWADAHPHEVDKKKIARGSVEPAVFTVRADPSPAAGAPFEETAPSLQFLDRVVLIIRPAANVEVIRDGRRIAELPAPVILVDTGAGMLEPDEGALRNLLASAIAGSGETGSAAGAGTAGLFPFVEAVRRRTLERIMRALPSAAELRPVDVASLRDNASFYQALAWLELPIKPAQHGPLRQALRSRDGEIAALRSLCRATMVMLLARETRRPLNALDKERLEAWLSGGKDAPGTGELPALHHCLAVLAWEYAGWTLAHGVRPDPMNLNPHTDEDRIVLHAERIDRFRRLHEMGLLDQSREDLVVGAHELAESADRIMADWNRAAELIRIVQAEIGIHPQVELTKLSAAVAPGAGVETPLLAALSDQLRHRLQARGQAAASAERQANALAVRLAAALSGDYRLAMAFAAHFRLHMPRFFEAAASQQGAPLFEPAIDPQELRDWIAPKVSDIPLVRAWKEDLRRQTEAPGEQARRQT